LNDAAMIRITGGEFKGRPIQSPANDAIRPTTGLVRESLFNQLQSVIGGVRFLDLFAGSGLMGFEALSRGADFVLAVEKQQTHARLIRRNVQQLGISDVAYHLLVKPVEMVLKQTCDEPFDVVFMDPPYGYATVSTVLSLLVENQWLHDDTLVVVEQASDDPSLVMGDVKTYGTTRLTRITGRQLLKR